MFIVHTLSVIFFCSSLCVSLCLSWHHRCSQLYRLDLKSNNRLQKDTCPVYRLCHLLLTLVRISWGRGYTGALCLHRSLEIFGGTHHGLNSIYNRESSQYCPCTMRVGLARYLGVGVMFGVCDNIQRKWLPHEWCVPV